MLHLSKIYKNTQTFLRNMSRILGSPKLIYRLYISKQALTGKAFASKLLIITANIFHNEFLQAKGIKQAESAGVSPHEINYLKRGIPGKKGGKDSLALLYALHWCKRPNNPDTDFRAEIIGTYGHDFIKETELRLTLYTLASQIFRVQSKRDKPTKEMEASINQTIAHQRVKENTLQS